MPDKKRGKTQWVERKSQGTSTLKKSKSELLELLLHLENELEEYKKRIQILELNQELASCRSEQHISYKKS